MTSPYITSAASPSEDWEAQFDRYVAATAQPRPLGPSPATSDHSVRIDAHRSLHPDHPVL